MIAIGPLVLLMVVVLLVVLGRSHGPASAGTPSPAGTLNPRTTNDTTITPLTEAVGYVGATLVMSGLFVLTAQFWQDLSLGPRLAIVGAVAALLFGVGVRLSDESDPVIWRLRSFVWLLSSGAFAGLVAEVVVDGFAWRGEPVAISIGGGLAAFSLALWRLHDRPAQQLTTFVGTCVAVGGMMALVDGGAAIGLSVMAIGAAWVAGGTRALLPPKLLAVPLGVLGLLVGPAIIASSWPEAGPVLGVVMAVGLISVGTSKRTFLLTGAGAAGLFVFVPWTIGQLFGDVAGAPVVLLTSGAVLLGVMMLLMHRHGDSSSSMPRHHSSVHPRH